MIDKTVRYKVIDKKCLEKFSMSNKRLDINVEFKGFSSHIK